MTVFMMRIVTDRSMRLTQLDVKHFLIPTMVKEQVFQHVCAPTTLYSVQVAGDCDDGDASE